MPIHSFGCFWLSGFRMGFSSPVNENRKNWAGVLPSGVDVEVSEGRVLLMCGHVTGFGTRWGCPWEIWWAGMWWGYNGRMSNKGCAQENMYPRCLHSSVQKASSTASQTCKQPVARSGFHIPRFTLLYRKNCTVVKYSSRQTVRVVQLMDKLPPIFSSSTAGTVILMYHLFTKVRPQEGIRNWVFTTWVTEGPWLHILAILKSPGVDRFSSSF